MHERRLSGLNTFLGSVALDAIASAADGADEVGSLPVNVCRAHSVQLTTSRGGPACNGWRLAWSNQARLPILRNDCSSLWLLLKSEAGSLLIHPLSFPEQMSSALVRRGHVQPQLLQALNLVLWNLCTLGDVLNLMLNLHDGRLTLSHSLLLLVFSVFDAAHV